MKTLVRINKEIPVTIFNEPVLQKQVIELLNGLEEKIKARFNEIITFLEADDTDELSYGNIAILFKGYFYKLILNEAVEITFSRYGKYDVLANILSLLTEEKLESAIMGEPMIDAFSNAIRSIPTTSGLSACLNGSKILLLKKEFLGKSICPTFEKKEGNEQSNYYGDCGCSCTCECGCKENTKNVSKRKLFKNIEVRTTNAL